MVNYTIPLHTTVGNMNILGIPYAIHARCFLEVSVKISYKYISCGNYW